MPLINVTIIVMTIVTTNHCQSNSPTTRDKIKTWNHCLQLFIRTVITVIIIIKCVWISHSCLSNPFPWENSQILAEPLKLAEHVMFLFISTASYFVNLFLKKNLALMRNLWLCRVGGKSERSSLQRKEFWAASKQKQCIALSSRSKSVQSKWNQRLCLLLPKNFYQLVSITIVCKNAAHQFPSKNAILKFSLVFNLFCNLLKISNAWDCNLFKLTLWE